MTGGTVIVVRSIGIVDSFVAVEVVVDEILEDVVDGIVEDVIDGTVGVVVDKTVEVIVDGTVDNVVDELLPSIVVNFVVEKPVDTEPLVETFV
uniref:Uncharacterized protein n=1 Tax=Panagrolaimus sp. JU765 TaxID=591449 RepID=A0AC34QPJ6_9BILA